MPELFTDAQVERAVERAERRPDVRTVGALAGQGIGPAPAAVGPVSATGTGTTQVSPAEMRRASATFDALAATFEALAQRAHRLSAPPEDGWGPVASSMRTLFAQRAVDAHGVVPALVQCHAEVSKVADVLARMANDYESADVLPLPGTAPAGRSSDV